MPFKKRKAAPETTLADSKKVKFDDETKTTLDSGRPKRESAGEPNYDLTRRRLTAGPTADDKKETPSEPASVSIINGDLPKRGRGRPPKQSEHVDEAANTDEATNTEGIQPKRGRGRPPKQPLPPATKVTKNGKQVGRPPKRQSSSNAKSFLSAPGSTRLTVRQAVKAGDKVTRSLTTPSSRKRSAAPPPSTARGRGRPPKGTKPIPVLDPIDEEEEEDDHISEASPAGDSREWSEESEGDDYEVDASGNLIFADDADDEVEDQQYWLMKAEPESRIVNGVDVKFSIDDLMAAKAPEPWVSDTTTIP